MVLLTLVLSGLLLFGQACGPGGRSAPPPPPPATSSPGCTVAFGYYDDVAPGDLSHLNGLEQQVGQHVSVLHWYQQWGGDPQWTSLRQSDLQAAANHRAVPFITWEPWDPQQPQTNPFPLKDLVAGRFDAHIDAWAQGLRQFARPVFLSFAHEMNESTYPWGRGVNGNTPADYVAAYRHVHDRLVAGGAANVRWVWTLDGGADPAQQPPASAYYPGDGYVDWLGTDTHNFGTTTAGVGGLPPGPPVWSTWRSAQDTIARGYDVVAAVNGTKPIMLAEIGSAEQGGDKAGWIRDTATLIPQRFPRVMAVAWFGSIDGPFSFLRLDSSATALQAARDGFGRAPYCGSVT